MREFAWLCALLIALVLALSGCEVVPTLVDTALTFIAEK
jgi:hypothetical protein